MKNFEETVLQRLQEIQNILEGTLNKEKDFTVATTGADGTTYTYDREKYLELGMEIANEQLQFLIEDVAERTEKKSRFKIMK